MLEGPATHLEVFSAVFILVLRISEGWCRVESTEVYSCH